MEPESPFPYSYKLTLVPIMSQVNQIHALLPYLFKIHLNIILPSMSMLFSSLFPLSWFKNLKGRVHYYS